MIAVKDIINALDSVSIQELKKIIETANDKLESRTMACYFEKVTAIFALLDDLVDMGEDWRDAFEYDGEEYTWSDLRRFIEHTQRCNYGYGYKYNEED